MTTWCVTQDKRDVLEHVHLSNQFGDGLASVKDQVELCIPAATSGAP